MFNNLFSYGETNISINGEINKILSTDIMDIRNCPSYVDSCIYICIEGTNNPCHPEDLYSISIDTSESGESTEGLDIEYIFHGSIMA